VGPPEADEKSVISQEQTPMLTKAVPMTDLVVERVRGGDTSAFETLYTLYKCSVFALCLRLTSNISDAEDLTQEVFLQVHRKVNSFRGEAAFGSWLYRVAINASMMHFRRRHPEELSFDTFESESFPNALAAQPISRCHVDPVERIALVRALADLSKGRRTVVVLHDLKGLTHREVAQRLGVTVSSSRSQLHQAHRKLRDILTGKDMRTHRRATACITLQDVDVSDPTAMDSPVRHQQI
jgi:RNA polymerase sigma-70 factor, ECF subfamily